MRGLRNGPGALQGRQAPKAQDYCGEGCRQGRAREGCLSASASKLTAGLRAGLLGEGSQALLPAVRCPRRLGTLG